MRSNNVDYGSAVVGRAPPPLEPGRRQLLQDESRAIEPVGVLDPGRHAVEPAVGPAPLAAGRRVAVATSLQPGGRRFPPARSQSFVVSSTSASHYCRVIQ